MNRRNFMSSILALGAAPAIVRAESIMRIKPIVLPGDFEYDAIHYSATGSERIARAWLEAVVKSAEHYETDLVIMQGRGVNRVPEETAKWLQRKGVRVTVIADSKTQRIGRRR